MLLASLLPEAWFTDRNVWLLLLVAAVAMGFVIKGADWLVEGAAGIAAKLGMPKVVIGATIVSLGTTSPEAAVSVLAAWSGKSGLALGNGVGSIIADTGLIFGIGCLMTALPADRFVLSRQGWVQFGSAVMLAAICYGAYAFTGPDASLGLWIGLLLVALLVAYLWISVRWAKAHPSGEPFVEAHDDEPVQKHATAHPERSILRLTVMGVIGLVVVIFAGDVLVNSVSDVARQWGVPKTVIAATLVAFGTSLPELVVGITSIRKGHAELLVGNVIGADILNVLFVIGASAVGGAIAGEALPVVETLPDGTRSYLFLTLLLPTMLIMLALFRIYIFRAVKIGHFSRWMGVPLVVMYVAYVAIQFVASA